MDIDSTFLARTQALMARQYGISSREQLIDLGVPGKAIDQRLRRGQIKPVFTGKYMMAGAPLTRKGLWVAALLKGGRGSLLCSTTAAALWGFMEVGPVVEVLSTRHARVSSANVKVEGERRSSLFVPKFRSFAPDHLVRLSGFPLTNVEVTLAHLAADLDDEEFYDVFSEADRLNLINDRALTKQVEERSGLAGGPLLAAISADRDPNIGRTRSRLEVKLSRLLKDQNIEKPEVNVMIEGHLADFVWRKQRLIVETDGYRYHRGREKFEKDAATRNRLRSRGWTVLVYTYRMVTMNPIQVGDEIRAALEGRPNPHEMSSSDEPGSLFTT